MSKDTLPPDPGSQQTVDASMVVSEDQVRIAQGEAEAAQRAYFGVDPSGQDAHFARQRAEGEMMYAKQQLGNTQFRHTLYTNEQIRVDRHNQDVATADRDHDGISDQREIEQHKQDQLLKTGMALFVGAQLYSHGFGGFGPSAAFGVMGAMTMVGAFRALSREPSEPGADPMHVGPTAMFNGYGTQDPLGRMKAEMTGPEAPGMAVGDAPTGKAHQKTNLDAEDARDASRSATESIVVESANAESRDPSEDAVDQARQRQILRASRHHPHMGMGMSPKPPSPSGGMGMG